MLAMISRCWCYRGLKREARLGNDLRIWWQKEAVTDGVVIKISLGRVSALTLRGRSDLLCWFGQEAQKVSTAHGE